MKLIDLHEQSQGLIKTKLSLNDAVSYVKTNCKAALKSFLEHDVCMYRENRKETMGGDYEEDFLLVDPTKTTRVSANTSNFYTEIFDSHPKMTEFPKRSRSMIAYDYTNLSEMSSMYDTLIIFPFDSAKIGRTNQRDLWDVRIKLFDGHSHKLNTYNIDWSGFLQIDEIFELRKDKSFIELLEAIDKKLKEKDELITTAVKKYFDGISEKALNNFLASVYDAYAPQATGLTWEYSKAHKWRSGNKEEIWIGGKIVCIPVRHFQKFEDAIK